MMWESIPGSALQTFAIISRFEDRSSVQIASVLASALSVGIISSKMSYHVDIGIKNREKAGKSLPFSKRIFPMSKYVNVERILYIIPN
jgi:hypothetical protein